MNPMLSMPLLAVAILCAGCQPKAQITVRVVDDEGKSVENAEVAVLGLNREKVGRTDRQGKFTATVRNSKSSVDLVVDKNGYYSINRHVHVFSDGLTDGRWLPWNPEVELQLRRKGKPAAMIEKEIRNLEIPVNDQPVGFDLELGDWVVPYGQGRISDFIFLARCVVTNEQDFASSLLLTFSNSQDGLIIKRIPYRNSYGLLLPAIAPETGYSNRWEFILNAYLNPASGHKEVESNSGEDDNYYLRIRTRLASDGRIQSAMYGKIYRGITHGPNRRNGKLLVSFEYFLNSDGTRNTESISDRRRIGDVP
jgi:hypothetical protein